MEAFVNWWKQAQLKNFEDRNIWNDKIDDLKEITVALTKMSKLVFQTGRHTREMLHGIMATKRLSSYPVIEGMLTEADKLCLDSPYRFSMICKLAAGEVISRINKLESEKKSLNDDTLPERSKQKWKGWKAND
jgi:hypothetical protein